MVENVDDLPNYAHVRHVYEISFSTGNPLNL
jgi:hypothetical protein